MAKRGPGRPRKDGMVRDEEGNLVAADEQDTEVLERDIPEDEPESPNETAAASSAGDLEALKAALKEELRAEIQSSLPAAQREPDGVWRVNYNQEHYRVHGGKEVEHPRGFRPLPPEGIPMYEAVGGGTTSNLEQAYRFLPEFDQLGHVKLDDQGNPVGKKIPVGKVAKKGPDGKPVLTAEYKHWLHVRSNGGRRGSNVMSDIRAGKGIQGVTDGDPLPVDADGVPVTNE